MSRKRKLTNGEIQDILNIIQPQKKIPLESAMSIVNINREQLKEQLVDVLIYPNKIPELKLKIKEMYFSSRIQPGECVGILCAQSIVKNKHSQISIVFIGLVAQKMLRQLVHQDFQSC